MADLLASALGPRGACLPKSGGLRADDALRRLLGACGLEDRGSDHPAAADPAACKAVLWAAEACLDDAVLSAKVEARPLLAAPPYMQAVLLFSARLKESLSEASKSGLAVEGGGLEVLQERLLGVLGSLVCAMLFPPEGLEPLQVFCSAYLEPSAPSMAKPGAAGDGDAVEGAEKALSAAELGARGQEDFGVLASLLLQDAAAAAQCLPWALDLFEEAIWLRNAMDRSVDAVSDPVAPGPGMDFRPAAGLFFALADRVCARLPDRRGGEAPDRGYVRELEALEALLAWMLASRERLAPLFGLLKQPFQRLGAALVSFLRLQAELMDVGSSAVDRYNPRAVDLGLSCLISVLDLDSRVVASLDHTVWLAVWSLPRWRLLRELEGGQLLHEDTLAPLSGVGGAATRLFEAYCGAGRSQKMLEDWTLGQEALWEGSSSPFAEAEQDPRFVALGLFRPALASAAGRALAAATPWASVEMVEAVTARLKHGLEGALPSPATGSAAGALIASLYTGGSVLLSVPYKPECAPHLIRHCLTVLRSVAAALVSCSLNSRRALLPPVLFVGFSAATLLRQSGSEEAAPSGIAATARTFARSLSEDFKLAYALHRARAVGGSSPWGALKVILDRDFGVKPESLAGASVALARAWDPEDAGFGSDAVLAKALSPWRLVLAKALPPLELEGYRHGGNAASFVPMVLEVAEACGSTMSAWNGVTVSPLSIPSFMVATLLWGPGGAPAGTSAEDSGVAIFESLKSMKVNLKLRGSSGIRSALSQALRIGPRACDAASLFFASAPLRMQRADGLALRSGCIRTRKRRADSRPPSQRAKIARVAKERRKGRTRGTSDPDAPSAEAQWDALAAPGADGWGLAQEMLEEDISGWSSASRARHGRRVAACVQRLLTLLEGSAVKPGEQPRCDLGALLEEVLQRTDLNFEPHAQVLLCHAATLALTAPGGLSGPEHDGGQERLLAATRAAVGRLVARSKRFKFLEGRMPPADVTQTR